MCVFTFRFVTTSMQRLERTTVKLNDIKYILFLHMSDLSILPQKYVVCIFGCGPLPQVIEKHCSV